MEQKRYYPLFLSDGTNYQLHEEMKKKYLEKYEWSADGRLQYVTAIIRNDEGAILVGYNKKHGSWQIPSGKIDKGEGIEETLQREIKEELSLDVITSSTIGASRAIFYGMPREGHFHDVKVNGTLRGNEEDTMDQFDRVKCIDTNSWLGFGLVVQDRQIIEPEEILTKWHMFAELYLLEHVPAYKQYISETIYRPLEIYDADKRYIQYRDSETHAIEVVEYDMFMSMIQG